MDQNYYPLKTPLCLYLKLYSEKKSGLSRKDLISEATKSWLSLTKEEKQKFENLFTKLQAKQRKAFADYLQNADLYMKKIKDRSSTVKFEQIEIHENDVSMALENSCGMPFEEASSNVQDINESIVHEEPHLPKPTPPKFKTAIELFEMMKTMGECGDMLWVNMTKNQKAHYQRATLVLKREYIKNYRKYLESLPTEELYNIYNTYNDE